MVNGSASAGSGIEMFMHAGIPDFAAGMCRAAAEYGDDDFHEQLWADQQGSHHTWVEIELPEICQEWPFNEEHSYEVWGNRIAYEVQQWEHCHLPQ